MLKPKSQLKESRRHRRVTMKCRVEINHPIMGSHIVEMRDFSDGGIFLCMDKEHFPPVGTIIQGQVKDINGDAAPVINMEVVRIEPRGIALKFVEDLPSFH